MKKLITYLLLSILLLLTSNNWAEVCNDICNISCDCNCWILKTQVGLCPIIWPNDGHLFFNSCNCGPTLSTDIVKLPSFDQMFRLPFIVGLQFGYSWNECFALYGELNYLQAKRKRNAFIESDLEITEFSLQVGRYRAISGYVGVRYYLTQLFCNTTSFFIGGKLGFIHHFPISIRELRTNVFSIDSCNLFLKQNFFNKSTMVSGGICFGLERCICDGPVSLILMGEVVANSGPRGNSFIPLIDSEIGVKAINVEIAFPITIGLAYNF